MQELDAAQLVGDVEHVRGEQRVIGQQAPCLGQRGVRRLQVADHVSQQPGALAMQCDLGRPLVVRQHARQLLECADLDARPGGDARQLLELAHQAGA